MLLRLFHIRRNWKLIYQIFQVKRSWREAESRISVRDLGISFFAPFPSHSQFNYPSTIDLKPLLLPVRLISLFVSRLSSLSMLFLPSELELVSLTRPFHERFKTKHNIYMKQNTFRFKCPEFSDDAFIIWRGRYKRNNRFEEEGPASSDWKGIVSF